MQIFVLPHDSDVFSVLARPTVRLISSSFYLMCLWWRSTHCYFMLI